MSKLEELVPPLELCKLIPKGEFEDSALMWIEVEIPQENKKEWRVIAANKILRICHNPKHSAPTLQEIMEKLHGGFNLTECNRGVRGWLIDCCVGIEDIYARDEHSGATAALKLWLKMKGVEVQNSAEIEQ